MKHPCAEDPTNPPLNHRQCPTRVKNKLPSRIGKRRWVEEYSSYVNVQFLLYIPIIIENGKNILRKFLKLSKIGQIFSKNLQNDQNLGDCFKMLGKCNF